MTCYVILLIISFLLEGILSNLILSFVPCFMISGIVLGSLLVKSNKAYYVITIIFGIIYDLTYSSTFVLNTSIFFLISYVIKMIDNDKNYFITILKFYLSIIIYGLLKSLISIGIIGSFTIQGILDLLRSTLLNTTYFSLFYLLFIGIKRVINHRKEKSSYF